MMIDAFVGGSGNIGGNASRMYGEAIAGGSY